MDDFEAGREIREYFSVTELAKHFGVNAKTIYRRLWAKGIPAYEVGNTGGQGIWLTR